MVLVTRLQRQTSGTAEEMAGPQCRTSILTEAFCPPWEFPRAVPLNSPMMLAQAKGQLQSYFGSVIVLLLFVPSEEHGGWKLHAAAERHDRAEASKCLHESCNRTDGDGASASWRELAHCRSCV